MSPFWIFLVGLTIVGTLFYNVAVRMAGGQINPFVFTVLLTIVAMIGHLLAFGTNKVFFTPDLKFSFTPQTLALAAVAGLGVVVIDLAYFYAVRENGLAATNAFWVVGGLLATVIVSLFIFSEGINLIKALGIALGVASLLLLSKT